MGDQEAPPFNPVQQFPEHKELWEMVLPVLGQEHAHGLFVKPKLLGAIGLLSEEQKESLMEHVRTTIEGRSSALRLSSQRWYLTDHTARRRRKRQQRRLLVAAPLPDQALHQSIRKGSSSGQPALRGGGGRTYLQ